MKAKIFKLKLAAYFNMISEQYKTWISVSTLNKIKFFFKPEIENACIGNKHNFYVLFQFPNKSYTDSVHVGECDFIWVIKDTWIVHNENGPAFKVKGLDKEYYSFYGNFFPITEWLKLTSKEHLVAFL